MVLDRPWHGETAFLLGGGASLTQQIADQVRKFRTIVINSTARLAPWASVLFFADFNWFRDHRPIIDLWPGKVITVSRQAHQALPGKVALVAPPTVQDKVLTAGHHAVDVAIALGAKRIVLLGFDCRLVDARSHNHRDYRRPAKLYADTVLPMWAEYPERARQHGVEIVNATPGSAIDVFPFATLDRMM
jgi:hypothetical protein